MNFKYIEGGICAAKGFKASGTYCGIKKPAMDNQNPDIKHKNDICLYVSDVVCNAAAVYTRLLPIQKMPTPAMQTANRRPTECVSLWLRS